MATATNSLVPDSSTGDSASSLLANNNQTNVSGVSQIGFPSGTDSTGIVQPPSGNTVSSYPAMKATDASAPAGGLITGATLPNTTPGSTPDSSSSATTTPTSYTPTLNTISNKDTVSGQVNDLLSADNPIMQTARTQAAQAANSRGLLNSSMAVQSGEQAAINSALPIAQQDAATNFANEQANQSASNAGGQFNSNSANQLQLQGLRGDQATNVANIEANYKTLMQTSASATLLFSDTVKTIGALLDDPNTTQEQKQAAIDKQIQLLQTGMAAIGGTGGVDLSSLLDFSGIVTPGVAGTTAPAAPAAPATTAQGQPAPAGTPGAGHNVGDNIINLDGSIDQVNPDGSLTHIDSTQTYNG
jgi:hypothetical protein